MLATRSLTYTELLARVNIFLAILSGAVIALALVAQADRFGTLHPELEPYFITAVHDDLPGVLQTPGIDDVRVSRRVGSIGHLVNTLPGMLTAIVAAVAGAIVALIGAGFGLPSLITAILTARALTTSSGECVLAQTLRHRSNHLDRELVIPLDRVAELGMAQHHGLGRSFGHDRRGGWSLVKHPDLSEEVAGAKPGGRLAFANDMHMAARQNEKRSGWLPLRDQSLARLQADLIHLAGQKLQLTLAEFRKEGHLAQPFDLWIWHVRNSTPR